MIVNSRPLYQPIANKHPNNNIDLYPFNGDRFITYYLARYAIGNIIKTLGLTQDDEVLLPSYNCGVEIDAFLNNCASKLNYYNVKKNFEVDYEDIINKLTINTKVILVTHYFGFPQKIKKIKDLCQQKKIYLIEDCAHAFLSNTDDVNLGSYGDVSIFSFRKSIPVPDGGLLLINNEKLTLRYEQQKPNEFVTNYICADRHLEGIDNYAYKLFYTIKYSPIFARRYWYRFIHKFTKNKLIFLIHPESYKYYNEISKWSMSDKSVEIMKSIDYEVIKERRRNNFILLLEYFKDCGVVDLPLKSLPNGICPLIFPLYVNNRDFIHRSMKKLKYSGHDWWKTFHPDVQWENFPDALYMKENLYGLPIHQDLDENLLLRMAKIFRSIVQGHI